MKFPIHTIESAPEESRETLQAISDKYGFVPNLAAAFAESPATLGALLPLLAAFDGPGLTLSPIERQVVLVTASAVNGCHYCVAAHGMLSGKLGLSDDQIVRLQRSEPVEDDRLAVLQRFTRAVVEHAGRVPGAELAAFESAGFTRAQVFEVLLGVAVKTLTNYANHVVGTPVNEQFEAYRPERVAERVAVASAA